MAKQYYKLVAGSHVERDGKTKKTITYTVGDVVLSERNLSKQFKGKFVLAGRDDIPDPDATAQAEQDEATEAQAVAVTPKTPAADPDTPQDVTGQFEGAKEAALTVLKVGRTWTVQDDGAVVAANLKTKQAVGAAIAEFLAEQAKAGG